MCIRYACIACLALAKHTFSPNTENIVDALASVSILSLIVSGSCRESIGLVTYQTITLALVRHPLLQRMASVALRREPAPDHDTVHDKLARESAVEVDSASDSELTGYIDPKEERAFVSDVSQPCSSI